MSDKKKSFDNVASRGQLDSAKAESADIRNRVHQLEQDSFEALDARVRDLYSAVNHLLDAVTAMKEARALRGRG